MVTLLVDLLHERGRRKFAVDQLFATHSDERNIKEARAGATVVASIFILYGPIL